MTQDNETKSSNVAPIAKKPAHPHAYFKVAFVSDHKTHRSAVLSPLAENGVPPGIYGATHKGGLIEVVLQDPAFVLKPGERYLLTLAEC